MSLERIDGSLVVDELAPDILVVDEAVVLIQRGSRAGFPALFANVLGMGGGVGFPELVDFQIAQSHVLDPVAVPLVQFGGLDAGDGGSEGSMGS